MIRILIWLFLLSPPAAGQSLPPHAFNEGTQLRPLFDAQVDRRVNLPLAEQDRYAVLLSQALAHNALTTLPPQYFLLVDRHPKVQMVMLYWKSLDGGLHFIGASPCSTGRPGQYEHFETPLGVFEHALSSLDFRAEGTRNALGIRGYGVKGMRVYDFGWVIAERGWGPPGHSPMRLQMHSTDRDVLEPRLGIPHSKGCIRIPATLNEFVDRFGLLDAAYEDGLRAGQKFWVLRSDRQPTPWSGRYLVVVDTRDQPERPTSAPPSETNQYMQRPQHNHPPTNSYFGDVPQ